MNIFFFHVLPLIIFVIKTSSPVMAVSHDSISFGSTLSSSSPSSSLLAFVLSKQPTRKTDTSSIIKTFASSSSPDNNTNNNSPIPPPTLQTATTTTTTPVMLQPPISSTQVTTATTILTNFDKLQQEFISNDNNQGWGGGTSALHFLQNHLTKSQRLEMQNAVYTLIARANYERSLDSSQGRIMLGFCCANAYEALSGLKSWVSSLGIPRGLLHGMDVDGVPQPLENFGAVYVKYSTGGAMTFTEMRRSGRGFDALWKPGDALLETYDGDFRGVYLNLELEDGVFRQFGVLPTDLFMEGAGEDEDEDWDD